MAVGGDDDEILDPHPEATRHVDTGFDRDDVACDKLVVGALAQAWRLVHFEADAVAESVAEPVSYTHLTLPTTPYV